MRRSSRTVARWCDIDELRSRIEGVRRHGIRRLREAAELMREDAWSPRESKLRCLIVNAGLPEPALNQDIFDERGRFLGCSDLAYPEKKVANALFARPTELLTRIRQAAAESAT